MNQFLVGALFTFLTTTPQGNKIAIKGAKTSGTVAKKILKAKYGVDVNELLSAETEVPETTEEKQFG